MKNCLLKLRFCHCCAVGLPALPSRTALEKSGLDSWGGGGVEGRMFGQKRSLST